MSKKDMKLSLGAMPEMQPDMPTLTNEEMKAIEAQAREEVNRELKEKLRADYLAKTKADMKKKALFVEGKDSREASVEYIVIDLPKFSDRITIDSTVYFHGMRYAFAPKKAAVIKETMHRQWLHHAEINGLDVNEYLGRRHAAQVINPKSIGA